MNKEQIEQYIKWLMEPPINLKEKYGDALNFNVYEHQLTRELREKNG